MTPAEIASKIAEEVMQVIERKKRIIKADIAEAAEKVILTTQMTPAPDPAYGQPVFVTVTGTQNTTGGIWRTYNPFLFPAEDDMAAAFAKIDGGTD